MAWTEESRRKAAETKRLKGSTNQYTKAKSENRTLNSPLKDKPNLKWKPHTQETKDKLSIIGRNSSHRRLVKSVRFYTKLDGTIVQLDSSWEEALAKRLDSLNVVWTRPEPMKWIDKFGNCRNYFPDFYLPEYDLYLDPKNPEAARQQKEKVSWLKSNVENLIFLNSLNEIENYVPIV